MEKLTKQLHQTKQASRRLAETPAKIRNRLIVDFGRAMVKNQSQILRANRRDLLKFQGDLAMRERLELNPGKIKSIVQGLGQVVTLPDPIGQVLETKKLANHLLFKKISVPLGVVAVIYESRPNVTVDLAALAIKSGNALVLKGGKESFETNRVLVSIMRKVLMRLGLPGQLLLLVNPESDWTKVLLNAHGLLDVIIPRGGAGLIEFVRKNATIPVIETGAGVCHTFVDENYDVKRAVSIIVNAKTQRPSVCNSLDTLVVHKKILEPLMKELAPHLADRQVEILADARSFKALAVLYPQQLLHHAQAADFGHEFLSLKLAIKTVDDFQQGLEFVQTHTSGHSEAILTQNTKHAKQFCDSVDAAVVYVNASTRFTDGGKFGMGAEVGVSTQKLHVRGPMGAQALTSYKWQVWGSGQVRK